MLEKNKIYEAEIVDYTSEGQGIAKVEGCAVFIPNAIVGEICRIRIERRQKPGHRARSWRSSSGRSIASTGRARWRSSAAAVPFTIWTTKKKAG